MSITLDKNYIDKTLDNLINLLGIHENLSTKKVYRLINKDINKANEIITEHIGIPNPVYVEFVKNRDFTTSSVTEKETPSFISAQIEIPPNLPIYGDKRLKNIPIKIKLDTELKTKPKEILGNILAHENTHLILELLRYPRRDVEFDIDLASIILGLGELLNKGRIYRTYDIISNRDSVETYGYLDDASFNYAYKKIKAIHDTYATNKRDFIKKIKKTQRLIEKLKNLYNCFQKNLNLISKILPSIKVTPNHSKAFVDMGNFEFTHFNFNKTLLEKSSNLEQLKNKINFKKVYYPSKEYQFFMNVNKSIADDVSYLKRYYNLIKQWLKIELKYIHLFQKVKTIITLIKN